MTVERLERAPRLVNELLDREGIAFGVQQPLRRLDEAIGLVSAAHLAARHGHDLVIALGRWVPNRLLSPHIGGATGVSTTSGISRSVRVVYTS